MEFSTLQLVLISLIFIWSGFARSGFGFGGAVLSMPLFLLVEDAPLFFLPIVAIQLLFFTAVTSAHKLENVHWPFVKTGMTWMLIPKLAGVIGLLSLPAQWMILIIYAITMFYAIQWLLKIQLGSNSLWTDRIMLMLGGYFSGVSLVGAPLIVTAAVRQVPPQSYRDTLFVLWFMLVIIKMAAFVWADVDLQWQWALIFMIPATIGHFIGLRFHDYLVHHKPEQVKRVLGMVLLVISIIGIQRLLA
jgi:uncharacterized membrane protein YfcA